MPDVNSTFFITLLIISIGFILKKINILKEEYGIIISKLIFNITLPATILKFTSSVDIENSYILLPIISIIFSSFMAIIGLFIFRRYFRSLKGALIITMVGFNVANFSFPLIEGIWGAEGMPYIALIDAGNAFSIFVLCYILGSIYSTKNQVQNKKVKFKYIIGQLIRSPPLVCYAIALIINFSGLTFPVLLNSLIDILSRANSALVLLLLGIFLSFKFEKQQWINISKVLIIRYSFGLIVGILIFMLLPEEQFSYLFRIIIMLSLVLPVGFAVIPFSIEFDYDQKLIAMLVNLSIIISFFLLWILLLFING
ncbi:MAG: AEC family transporter [Candidatus Thorarchaeota archaeon]